MATKIKAPQLKTKLKRLLADFRPKGATRYSGFSDARYQILSSGEWDAVRQAVIIGPIVKSYELESKDMDCDDFALLYKAHASLCRRGESGADHGVTPCIGVCWGRFKWTPVASGGVRPYHAVNFVLLDDGSLWWIDSSPAGRPDWNKPARMFPLSDAEGDIRFVLV